MLSLGGALALVLSTPPGGLLDDPDGVFIYGGEEVGACGWPSVVYLSGSGGACTGVLVHPRVVMTAAHCVTDGVPTSVRFGENAATAFSLSDTVVCRQGPGWTGATAQGQDYGYCLLETPVTAVPIIPVAAGCEQTAIQPGARIVHVGFGVTEDGSGGRKKMLDTQIDNVTAVGEILSGDFDEIICNGDSGGPTFVYLDPALGGDGTWRVAAIHSWAQGADPVDPNCSGQAGSVLVANAIDWVEQDSGIDITPCTDGDAWAPTAHCGGLPTEPWIGEGGYTSACTSPAVVDFSGVCGAPLDATPDDAPPVVEVVTPAPQQQFEAGGDPIPVDVEIAASDEGWGVASVDMTIRGLGGGAEQTDHRDEWLAWTWQLTVPSGAYEIEAVATDHAGNVSEPVVVCFGVGEACPEPEPETGTDTGGSTGDALDDTGTSDAAMLEDDDSDTGGDETGATGPPAGDDGGPGGCGCRSAPRSAGPGTLGLALALLALVRRRRDRS